MVQVVQLRLFTSGSSKTLQLFSQQDRMCQLTFTLSLNPKAIGSNASEEMDFTVRVSLNGQRERKVSS